jgi:hypothetical protein
MTGPGMGVLLAQSGPDLKVACSRTCSRGRWALPVGRDTVKVLPMPGYSGLSGELAGPGGARARRTGEAGPVQPVSSAHGQSAQLKAFIGPQPPHRLYEALGGDDHGAEVR